MRAGAATGSIAAALLALLLGANAAFAGPAAVIAADGRLLDAQTLVDVARALDEDPEEVTPLLLPAGWTGRGATLAPCTARLPLGQALQDAGAAAEQLDSDAVVAALEPALAGLACAEPALDSLAVVELLASLAQAAQEVGRPELAEAAYVQLLLVEPGYVLPFAPGSGYEDPWNRAVGRVADRQTRAVAVIGPEGFEVAGAPHDGAPLRAGRHPVRWSVGGAEGAGWLTVEPGDAPATLLLLDPSTRATLVEQPGALDALHALATERGAERLVVLDPGPALGGWVLQGGERVRLPAAPPLPAAARRPVRLAVGGGWSRLASTHHGSVRGAVDVALIGPLALRVDASLELARVDLGPDNPWTGSVAALPGVGVGVQVRAPTRHVQPLVGITGGLWFSPPGASDELRAAALEAHGPDAVAAATEQQGPVRPRLFLDGGIDLLPGDSPVAARVVGGVGVGIGLQLRAASLLVVPIGRVPSGQ